MHSGQRGQGRVQVHCTGEGEGRSHTSEVRRPHPSETRARFGRMFVERANEKSDPLALFAIILCPSQTLGI